MAAATASGHSGAWRTGRNPALGERSGNYREQALGERCSNYREQVSGLHGYGIDPLKLILK